MHRDGWTSAHGGTVSPDQLDEEEVLILAAGLTSEESAVLRAVAKFDLTWDRDGSGERVYSDRLAAIAAEVTLSPTQVRRRIQQANAKLAAYADAVRSMR